MRVLTGTVAAFARATTREPEQDAEKVIGTLRERSEHGREEWAPRSRQPRESGRPPRARSAGSEPSGERGEH
jgi:hypothetical protein